MVKLLLISKPRPPHIHTESMFGQTVQAPASPMALELQASSVWL